MQAAGSQFQSVSGWLERGVLKVTLFELEAGTRLIRLRLFSLFEKEKQIC